jgi:hypothetical protein
VVILFHCSAFSAAGHQLRVKPGHLPEHRQLLNVAEGPEKVTSWVIQREIVFKGNKWIGRRKKLKFMSLVGSPPTAT